MNCEACSIDPDTRSEVEQFLCERCREEDPCRYLLRVAYDGAQYTPFTFDNALPPIREAAAAFEARGLPFEVLEWDPAGGCYAPHQLPEPLEAATG